ncbi:MAG: hypothetical protein ACKV2U_28650 [Bryobacteraceae bacterium]
MNKLYLTALAAASTLAFAVETRSFQHSDFSDFEKGKFTRLSLSSDGRIRLAPAVKELADASSPYLWSCAVDSKGNIYTGAGSSTGTTAKLWRVDAASGKAAAIADLEGLGIHAIAIDAHDNVYAATSPDGNIYRIRNAPNAKPEVYYEPRTKYIWALLAAPNGDLYAATGEKAEIHRITAAGKGSAILSLEENHVRSFALDAQGNLIAGTEPNGLVLRITPSSNPATSFVLYQTAKREVTAIALAKDGSIYAAANGNRPAPGAGPSVPPAPIPTPPPNPAAVSQPGSSVAAAAAAAAAARNAGQPFPMPQAGGGSDVYRIMPDGFPRRIFTSPAIIYALAIDAADRPLAGTGNRGQLFRLDTDQSHTLLTTLPPTQITALAETRNGALIAATGNIGKVFQIGPQLESSGVYESESLDASAFSYWGRLSHQARPAAGSGVKFETRSGNLSSPQTNWTPWAAVPGTNRIASPPARFIQYRATLTAASEAAAKPELRWVDVAYQLRNIAPVIEEIEFTQPNYRFPAAPPIAASNSAGAPASISLQPLGQKRRQNVLMDLGSGGTLSYAKSHLGVRWRATDENNDTLSFKVEIRGVNEAEWKLLRDKISERHVSWDTNAFADGEYILRITASDQPSNTPGDTLTAVRLSDEFLIDNTGPKIETLSATIQGANIEATWSARDAQSIITRAEYSINGIDWIVAEPETRLSDARELNYKLSVAKPANLSECTLAIRVTDEFDNQTVEKVTVR